MKNTFLITAFVFVLSACTITINQDSTPSIPQNQTITLNETNETADIVDIETVVHNNCNGTAEVQQSAEKSQDIQIDISADIGINYELIKSTVYSRYSESSRESKSINLPIPARTRMEYTLKWTQESFDGYIVSNTTPEIGTYHVKRPISVELVQSLDLGCEDARGSIKSISVENSQGGLIVHAEIFIENRMHTDVKAVAYFEYADGSPVKDLNGDYSTVDGSVSSNATFTPDNKNQNLGVDIFTPFEELHVTNYGETHLRVLVALWDIWDTSKPHTNFAISSYYDFLYIFNPATPTPDECYRSLPSNLSIGMIAVVNTQNPAPNRIRTSPNGDVIGKVAAGHSVEITDGPVCGGGLRWWMVTALDDGLSGWTAEGNESEYWLIPSQ